ncbi:protein KINESIN LIGHT CHAIN-RELATED 3-like [Nymphaea colorata]|nr:protein KINESIN LIGHT CHAIN-RELATED 3-like [Nymphaea colorata]
METTTDEGGSAPNTRRWYPSLPSLKTKHHRRTTSIGGDPSPKLPNCASFTLASPARNSMESHRRTPATTPNDIAFLFFSAAHSLHLSGDDPHKAHRYAEKAVRILDSNSTSGLQLITSLHLAAATLTRLGRCKEAIHLLRRSVSISTASPDDPNCAHASFSGFMQLGDTYFAIGRYASAMECYESGLSVQKQALGDSDVRVAETCVYLAESYLQLLKLKEAEELCGEALAIQDGVSVRRVIGLVQIAKGEYETALDHLLLAVATLSSLSSSSPSQSTSSSSSSASSSLSSIVECAFLDAIIGEAYLALGRFDEAELAYHKGLAAFVLVYGEDHTSVGSLYVSLADLYLKRGSFNDAKLYCEKALLVYAEQMERHQDDGIDGCRQEEIGVGLSRVASLFESMGEVKHAVSLLEKARGMMGSSPDEGSVVVAGVEAQIGLLQLMSRSYEDAYAYLGSAVARHRAMAGGERSLVLAALLNQRGVACVGLGAIWEAAEAFEESMRIFERVSGAHNVDTLDVCLNLAGAYDAMGRGDDAINLLERVVDEEENRLGTAHPDVEHTRQWLADMLKEAGRSRSRKAHTLKDLLLLHKKNRGAVGAVAAEPRH